MTTDTGPREFDIPDLLYEFEPRITDDTKIEFGLTHVVCGTVLCDIEPNDSIATYTRMCLGHQCPPVHQRQNVRCEAVQSALENLRDADNAHQGMTPTITDVWREAEGYIADGISSCTCP